MLNLAQHARTVFGKIGMVLVGAAAAVIWYEFSGGDQDAGSSGFRGIRVLPPSSLISLVDGRDLEVVGLARRLGTPQAAYAYVRDRIVFDMSRVTGTPAETLREGAASCLGKATLLASLYRALGTKHGQIRVVTGQVLLGSMVTEHAWLEFEYDGAWIQQDPTPLFGIFEFGRFPGKSYTRDYVIRELFCFNDKDFAVVSQRNRLENPEMVPRPAFMPSDASTPGATPPRQAER